MQMWSLGSSWWHPLFDYMHFQFLQQEVPITSRTPRVMLSVLLRNRFSHLFLHNPAYKTKGPPKQASHMLFLFT